MANINTGELGGFNSFKESEILKGDIAPITQKEKEELEPLTLEERVKLLEEKISAEELKQRLEKIGIKVTNKMPETGE